MQDKTEMKDLHELALKRFDTTWVAAQEGREAATEDRRFYSIAGAQWEGSIGVQFENRPKIEVNKVHLAVIRVINEWRNNRITVDFVSTDGSENDALADVCDGLYRADEQYSGADEAYDTAFEEGVGGGFGAWRLVPEYENPDDDDDDRQRIRIEPSHDADLSGFFDPGAKRQDKRDARFCFVLSSMPREDYIEEYGDDPASWPSTSRSKGFDWASNDDVTIAEYFVIEETKKKVFVFKDLNGDEERYTSDQFEDDPELEPRLEATGSVLVREKALRQKRCLKYILSGGGVLDGPQEIPGGAIPVVPFFGKRWFVDGIERFMGHVRLAKDAQRLKNIQLSALAETAVVSGIEKPIFTPEQVAGHEMLWAEDNVQNNPYLLINEITGPDGTPVPSGPVGAKTPPNIPPALAALLQLTEADIQQILGSPQQGDVLQPNTSGKAVELVQNRIDMQSFIYLSNFAKAMKRSGEIWLSMAKELYVEPMRRMKLVGAMKEVSSITLGRKVQAPDGTVYGEGDLSRASFEVVVDVGPSFTSRREATFRAITSMIQMTPDPETQQVLAAMAVMNLDGEGVEEVREYFRRKLVAMGVMEPSKADLEKAKEAAQGQPDPAAVLTEAEAERSRAMTQKAEADTARSLAQARKAEADAAVKLAELAPQQVDDAQQAFPNEEIQPQRNGALNRNLPQRQ